MITTDQAHELLNGKGNVTSKDGSKIGSIGQIFLDDESGRPEWVTVKTGLFGTGESFVPLSGADVSGQDIVVPHTKDKIKDAPRVDDENGHLDPSQEQELFRYYGVSSTGDATGRNEYATGRGENGTGTGTRADTHTSAGVAGGVAGPDHDHDHDHDRDREGDRPGDHQRGAGHDTSGPNTDDAMTRSEERVDIGTKTESAGRARLRKYIVTENVTKTVPVSREEVRVEREPITDANRGDAVSGGDLTEEEHEVELKQERVVVDKETVPVERVRLDKDTVTEDQQVDEEVRKERIETDTDGVQGDRPGDGR